MAYTTIDDPTAYFQAKTYTGNAGTNAITMMVIQIYLQIGFGLK